MGECMYYHPGWTWIGKEHKRVGTVCGVGGVVIDFKLLLHELKHIYRLLCFKARSSFWIERVHFLSVRLGYS